MSIYNKCSYISIIEFISKYIMNVVSIFGIIANLICIIIFIKIIKTTQSPGNMYKYFLMKSIMDFLSSNKNIFHYFEFCYNCEASHSYLVQIWFIWFYLYFASIVETASALFEMAAIFDCFITIKSILKCCQTNLFFYSFSAVVIVLTGSSYILLPLSFKINSELDYNNETIYSSDYTDFGKSSFSNEIFFNSLIKDGIFFIILLIFNLMILALLKKTTDRKRSLAGNTNALLAASLLAERRKLIMIIATGLNYLIGHFPFLIFSFLYSFVSNMFVCYIVYPLLFYYTSFANSIFFYFFFNNIFKKFLIESIPLINRNTT
jgi:hypothetical protein